MYIKLVKSFLVSTLLLIGMNGTAIGGECENVLERVQDILKKRMKEDANTGTVPESMERLPYDTKISVFEEGSPQPLETENNGYCFKISGRWSQNSKTFEEIGKNDAIQPKFPPIIAYIFFKQQSINQIHDNLEVDSSYQNNESNNSSRLISLVAYSEDKKTFAGATRNDKEKSLKDSIIWLPFDKNKQGEMNSNEVVLCEGPCRDILGLSSIDTTNDVRMEPDGQSVIEVPTDGDQDGTREGVTSACTEPKISDKDLKEMKDQHQNEIKNLKSECKNKRQKIEENAITKSINSRIDFQFEDMNGDKVKKLTRIKLKPNECKPPKIEKKHTLKEGMRIHYKNCYSIPDFDILEAKPIIKDNTLTIIYKLKKSTPAKIKHIEMSVEMEGESKVTKSCSLQAKIVDSSTNKAVLENPFIFDSKEQMFSLEINVPIAWKGKSLVLKKGKKTDCQPKNGELKIMMEKDNITEDSILEIPKTTLYSTLGKALLVLNTMTGVNPVHEGSSSTTQLYPIADDQDSKELFIEMVSQTLLHLNGKYKDLIIGYRKNGELIFEEFTSYLDNHSEKKTAEKIVDSVSFTGNEFNWDSMIRAVNNHTHNPAEYAYWVFIGQSGLSDDKSYCENIPSKQEPLNQNVATYIYDFAVDENHYNPSLRELEDSSRSLPAIDCIDDNTNQHVVIFPQSKTKGWEKIIKNMLDNAFKSH